MLNKILVAVITSGVMAMNVFGFTPSGNKNLAVQYTFDEKIGFEEYEHFVKKELKTIGVYVNDPHPNVQDMYVKDFGKTKIDYIGFSSLMNETAVRPLLNKDPRLGGFSPFNLLLYRKKSDMKTVISHLTPEAILDIVQVEDKEVREKFIASFKTLDETIEKRFKGGKKSYVPLHALPKDGMMNFEIDPGDVDDIDDYMDVFEENFRSKFGEAGFIVAGFYNIKESLNTRGDQMPEFRSYWSFDLCHVPFSYGIFDGDAGDPLPQAGIFAPCSIYVYVKKGENKIVIGMPTVQGWSSTLNVTDDDKLRFMDRMDTEIADIFMALGGKPVGNENPFK